MSDIRPLDEQWLPSKQPAEESENSSRRQQKQPSHNCPRCESENTKFCYFNNYCISQPRYYCKACKRYWTQGGALRNVPVGGSCRKGKRARLSSPSSSSGDDSNSQPSLPQPHPVPQNSNMTNNEFANLGMGAPQQVPPNGNATNGEFANLGMGAANPVYLGVGGGYLSTLVTMQGLEYPLINGQFGGIGNYNYGVLQGFNNNVGNFRPQPNDEVYQMDDEIGNWTNSLSNTNTNVACGSGTNYWNNEGSTSGSSLDPNQWVDYHGPPPDL